MKKKGVTLIELIVVLGIFSIFTLAVMYFESAQYNIYSNQNAESQLQYLSKLAVDQISIDIKKCRLTSFSVLTNEDNQLENNTFSGVLDNSIYTPLLYIEEQDNTGYIYAIKIEKHELVKIPVTFNSFTLGTSSEVISNYNTNNYPNKFTTISAITSSFADTPAINYSNSDYKFIYTSYGNYYLVYCVPLADGSDDSSATHYQCKLIPMSSHIEANTANEKVITDNVDNISITAANVKYNDDYGLSVSDAFNIIVTLKKNVTINGSVRTVSRTFTTCASKPRFEGGDAGAEN